MKYLNEKHVGYKKSRVKNWQHSFAVVSLLCSLNALGSTYFGNKWDPHCPHSSFTRQNKGSDHIFAGQRVYYPRSNLTLK